MQIKIIMVLFVSNPILSGKNVLCSVFIFLWNLAYLQETATTQWAHIACHFIKTATFTDLPSVDRWFTYVASMVGYYCNNNILKYKYCWEINFVGLLINWFEVNLVTWLLNSLHNLSTIYGNFICSIWKKKMRILHIK